MKSKGEWKKKRKNKKHYKNSINPKVMKVIMKKMTMQMPVKQKRPKLRYLILTSLLMKMTMRSTIIILTKMRKKQPSSFKYKAKLSDPLLRTKSMRILNHLLNIEIIYKLTIKIRDWLILLIILYLFLYYFKFSSSN